jgi:hypothetical protein
LSLDFPPVFLLSLVLFFFALLALNWHIRPKMGASAGAHHTGFVLPVVQSELFTKYLPFPFFA